MFNNQLTAKELYTTNPSQFLQRPGVRSDQEDSAFNSSQTSMSQTNSQMMSSQMENSQSSSFDMFSQMMMSQQQGFSQQTENPNNPQRFYMKYMAKAPLFSKESDKNLLSRKRSYQEQLESNKQKAKERDDRDLVNTFINLVKECTDEVKSAATQIRKNVDKNISESASQFDRLIQKINEDLRSYHDTLTNAVRTREEQQATLEELQQHIAAKNAKIEVLELQLEAAKQQRDERVVKSLLEAYTEQQEENRQQITRMQEEQQAFCKTQINKLVQHDREKYLLQCQTEKDVTGSSNRYMTAQDGLRPSGTMIDADGQPGFWQGLPQVEQSGYQSRPASRYQEDLSYLNKMTHMHQTTRMSHQNDVNYVSMGAPRLASISQHAGNTISFPGTSGRWSTPHGFQNGQPYMHLRNQYESSYSVNQATVNQQTRSVFPDISSYGQDTRPSGYSTQKNIGPSMISPTLNCNHPVQWNENRLKPSPVAAVAPQIKSNEMMTSHTTQGQNSQEYEHAESETLSETAPRRIRGRKQYQIAVKTKRQSARVKAKQNMSSLTRENEVIEEENQARNRQNGRRESRDAVKPGLVSPGSELGNKDVCEDREPVPHNRKQAYEKPTIRYLQEYLPEGRIQRSALNSKEEKQPQKRARNGQMPEVSRHVAQQVHKTAIAQHLPKIINKDEYEYTKAAKETNRSVKMELVRGEKQTSQDKHKAMHQASQDDIFSQKRIKSYSGSKNAKHHSLEILPSKTHTATVKRTRDKKLNNRHGNSSEDEEYNDSQIQDVDSSQELVSQHLIDDEKEGHCDEQISNTAGRMNILRKTYKQINRKPYQNVSQMKLPQGNQLDAMPSFSDQDDSSEDLTFSLKLPDSPGCKMSSLHRSKKPYQQVEEQVVPVVGTSDILSTPYIQLPEDQDSDNKSTCTVYSVTSGRKMSRKLERKRRLSRYSGSSSAAMVEITNSLRLQQHKIRRVSSHR